MPLSLEQYATHLDGRDLPWPAPPEVVEPKAKPHLARLPNVRAVSWSVYGTLLALSGGDLYFEHPQDFIMEVALDKTVQEFNMWASMSRKPGQPADYMRQIYKKVLTEVASSKNVKNGEVSSERVWEAVVKKLLQKDYKFDTGFYGSLNEYSAKIAYFFHSGLQGTACYPNAARALREVVNQGVLQTLIANAQAFTTLQLQRALAEQDPSVNLADVIALDCASLSFQVGVRKPSDLLFRTTLNSLKERGIGPEQVLHVGSRISQDIIPAKRLGMKTALFAGDVASLEATAEQLKSPSSRPDVLLTRLEQIAEILAVS